MRTSLNAVRLLAIVALLALTQGCAGTNAEKTVHIAYQSTNAFVEYDHAHRDELKAKAPEVHKVAEKIREEAPGVFLAAFDAIQTFKTNRDEANKQAMDASVEQAKHLGDEAAASLAEATATIKGGS